MIDSGIADDGFHEACAIVQDLDDTVARLVRALGYDVLWRGPADRGALDLLGIDSAVAGVEALVGDPGQRRGFIRLFAFPGTQTGVMRDGAQPWDVGGIFDINIRSLGAIAPRHLAMTRTGFAAFAPITAYTFGALEVKEVVERDADGLAIALIEQVEPPLPGFEHVSLDVSYVFNSTQTVSDFDAARALYVDALGWQVVHEARWRHGDGLNCIGLPVDVARDRELRVGIYQANGRNEGSVEILEVEGDGGRDFTGAAPPDRGWAALRFPVADIAGFLTSTARGGCQVLPPRAVRMEPYGSVEMAAAVTPWGARLEAYRLVAGA